MSRIIARLTKLLYSLQASLQVLFDYMTDL